MKTRIRPLLSVGLAVSTLVLAAPIAEAASTSSASACSPVVLYGKQICLSVDQQNVTATMIVQPGGRGWYGHIEIDGPTGQLLLTKDKMLNNPASWPNSVPSVGAGQYCAIDWRWDVYHQDYFEENHVCVTVS